MWDLRVWVGYEDLRSGARNSLGFRGRVRGFGAWGHVIYFVLGPGYEDLQAGPRNLRGCRPRVQGFGTWGT